MDLVWEEEPAKGCGVFKGYSRFTSAGYASFERDTDTEPVPNQWEVSLANDRKQATA